MTEITLPKPHTGKYGKHKRGKTNILQQQRWAIYDPSGEMVFSCYNRSRCIEEYLKQEGLSFRVNGRGELYEWDRLKRRGYKCRKFKPE
jgi:hypothetical protein